MEPQTSDFVERSYVPQRIWDKEGPFIMERIRQMREALGGNLVKVVLFPNAGHADYGTGQILNGAVYYLKKGTSAQALAPFIGPLYQHVSVFNLGTLSENQIKECKDSWQTIVDPPQTRGSGIPGVGENDCVDIVKAYMQKGRVSSEWSTSLGPKYQGVLGGIYKLQNGQCKLFLSGGHESAHRSLLTTIFSRDNIKIEDLADRKFALETESSLNQVVNAIKDVQKINHGFIGNKVMAVVSGTRSSKDSMDPYNHFDSPTELQYSCFVNTIHEVSKQKGMPSQVYALGQGVVDTNMDIEIIDKVSNSLNFYLVESPLRVHELSVNKEFLDRVRYFPLSTGCSEVHDCGMPEKDRSSMRNELRWTGVLGVHNAADLYYQPYDTTLKMHTNQLFNNQCFAIVESDVAMEGVIYTVAGLDPRPLTTDDYLKHTQHLEADHVIRAPANSAPVKMIFDTFPSVLEELRKQGIEGVDLFKVIKTDEMSNHFVQFPIGSLRIANLEAKKPRMSSPVDDAQGLPKITK